MIYLRPGLILLSIILASCGHQEAPEKFAQSEYDPELLMEYNLFVSDFRFAFENHPDTLMYAISFMDELIAKDPDFSPAYVSKHSYQCRLGDIDGAFTTIREFINREPDEINALSILGLMYEKIGQADSARQYVDLAIGRFSSRCRANLCTVEDQFNLIFLKFYRGDIDENEAIDDIRRITNESDLRNYILLIENFEREKFLKDLCRKTVYE